VTWERTGKSVGDLTTDEEEEEEEVVEVEVEESVAAVDG
jgi:hypothetical protein